MTARLSRIAEIAAWVPALAGIPAWLVDGKLAGACFIAAVACLAVRPVAWLCGRRAADDPTDRAGC